MVRAEYSPYLRADVDVRAETGRGFQDVSRTWAITSGYRPVFRPPRPETGPWIFGCVAILRFIKFHNYIIIIVTIFRHSAHTSAWAEYLTLPLLDSIYSISDMKYAEYIHVG